MTPAVPPLVAQAAEVVPAVVVPFVPPKPALVEPVTRIEVAAPRGPEIDRYFAAQLALGASDIHLSTDVVPMARLDGEMVTMAGFEQRLTAADTERILIEMMPQKNAQEFSQRHDTDFAYEFGAEARFRCNVYMDRKGMAGVFRVIPGKILTRSSSDYQRTSCVSVT